MGERLTVRYRLRAASADQARQQAEAICVEQTVEFPADLLPTTPPLRERIVGRIERLQARSTAGHGSFTVEISYAADTVGSELPQLLNVVFGNSSIKPGVRVERIELPDGLLAAIVGDAPPRLGRDGLRRLLCVPRRALLGTALKPMGLPPAALAEIAHACALGGIDLIKDDHGLADQPFCRYDERVARCAEAVARANALTGERCLYVANASAPLSALDARLRRAREVGVGGLLLAPGLVGWDTLRRVASDAAVGLPIVCHPALLGSFVTSSDQGMAHAVLLGQLPRLCGADATIFPHHGGRFDSFGPDDCRALLEATRAPMGSLPPIFPVPAGGIGLASVAEVRAFYGDEVLLLVGGDLHRGPDLVARCRAFRRLVEQRAP